MKKRLMTALLCGVMCVGGAMPVYAQTVTGEGNANVPVAFTKDQILTVTLPENITAAKGASTFADQYSVWGDIESNKKVTVTVADEKADKDGKQILLDYLVGGNVIEAGKGSATITSADGVFLPDEIDDQAHPATHSIEGEFDGTLTAGTWQGNAKFEIAIVNQ